MFENANVQSHAPRVVLSDNGLEFKGELSQFLSALGTSRVFSNTYSPVADIEAQNRQVRELMRATFIKYRSLDWLSHLADIATSMNATWQPKLSTAWWSGGGLPRMRNLRGTTGRTTCKSGTSCGSGSRR